MATIEDLKFDDKNFNKHTERGMGLLEKSLREFGAGRSILVDKDNNIIAGNGIVEAAANAGITKTKVIETDGTELVVVKRKDMELDSDKGREMAMADNATAVADLDWDKDNLAECFEPEELRKWDIDLDWDKDTEVVEDDAPEVNEGEPADSVLGGVYQLGRHRLMCGDSTDAGSVAILMDGQKADLLLTDPPYNIAYEGGSKKREQIENDEKDESDFRNFLAKSYAAAMDNMKSGAAYYIWLAPTEIYSFIGAGKDVGLELREVLVWNKNNSTFGRQDYHWKHELCLYGWTAGSHKWYGDRKQTTVLDFDRPSKSDEHPTMKPVELMAYQMNNSSKSGDSVLDLFGGSGSTLIACEQTGRKCYMMELDPKYCDVIRKRYWKFATGSEEGWQDGTKAVK